MSEFWPRSSDTKSPIFRGKIGNRRRSIGIDVAASAKGISKRIVTRTGTRIGTCIGTKKKAEFRHCRLSSLWLNRGCVIKNSKFRGRNCAVFGGKKSEFLRGNRRRRQERRRPFSAFARHRRRQGIVSSIDYLVVGKASASATSSASGKKLPQEP